MKTLFAILKILNVFRNYLYDSSEFSLLGNFILKWNEWPIIEYVQGWGISYIEFDKIFVS